MHFLFLIKLSIVTALNESPYTINSNQDIQPSIGMNQTGSFFYNLRRKVTPVTLQSM